MSDMIFVHELYTLPDLGIQFVTYKTTKDLPRIFDQKM